MTNIVQRILARSRNSKELLESWRVKFQGNPILSLSIVITKTFDNPNCPTNVAWVGRFNTSNVAYSGSSTGGKIRNFRSKLFSWCFTSFGSSLSYRPLQFRLHWFFFYINCPCFVYYRENRTLQKQNMSGR